MKKSVYAYAAVAGVPIGLYLTVMSGCLLMSLKAPALPMLLPPLALGFPLLLWTLMKRVAHREPTYVKVSALWLAGIYSVIFGTLICLLMSALYIVFVEPAFVRSYVSHAIESINSSPVASDYAATVALMQEAIDSHLLPSGLRFVVAMAWSTCFAGSILSLILSLVIVAGARRKSRRIFG